MITPKQLSELYLLACETELQAFKPGNVSIYSEGHDMTVNDFRISSEKSASPLCNPNFSLGEKIYYAVEATSTNVGCNTNLGIILLCAPLIHSAQTKQPSTSIKIALSNTLLATTVTDANWTFKAITLAAPGGLGTNTEQDVHNPATITLLQAMQLAASKDRIAFQYCNQYRDIFDFLTPIYYTTLSKWNKPNWAAVMVYLSCITQLPDSHIERKFGDCYTLMITEKMNSLKNALHNAERPESILPLLYSADNSLKSLGINPGTTADLTVATIFSAFLQDFKSL
ncbi:MAG: triphosphoribosyl-dephospho-CoA synthase [Methylococcaceae bacterium]|nr:MAG: triphosphoribosyl-dephospho-CoA synthase [Methylococcaceae bacterium]